MCVNFQTATSRELCHHFGVDYPVENQPEETWQDYLAPIVLLDDDGARICVPASYGLVPQMWKPPGVNKLSTMNARSETIGTLRNYKPFWQACQFCLVPVKYLYEPNYESGSHVRWRIGMVDDSIFAVAGIWRTWAREDGGIDCAFTQITINADDHPLMRRFHKPLDEKRMLVIVPPEDYQAWLSCRNPVMARQFLRPYPAERMDAAPAPRSTISG
ncbi:SOS response-associated peptidase family protein [Chitinivorax sp. B]|uniref:SOS response-associated peptidase n=1 Tax=Chitinivorax sp. B TaxID=2502235 RepID=UPI0010F73E1A|nr:SOS response-associated peptidase family protein [Chitinivorax sp. B]